MMDMEFGIYEKMSEYFATLARTELLTCSALQSSYNKLKDQSESVSRDFNYKCYLKTYRCLADHVQYAFEPVEGDTINTITPSEHDDGYSLKYEARTTAAKLNQAVKTIRAFRKRIKACEHHKAAGLKQEPNDAKGPNLDEKIEELVLGIRSAEVDLAKCKARLRKLREGDVEVDSYLDNANLDSLYVESEEARVVQLEQTLSKLLVGGVFTSSDHGNYLSLPPGPVNRVGMVGQHSSLGKCGVCRDVDGIR